MFKNRFGIHENVECGLVSYCDDPRKGFFGYSNRITIPIPLVSVSVFASVVHAVAQVEITQIYVNKEETPIETFYYFPLDSNGAVTHFHAEIDGRKIKGVVKSSEEAQAQYDKAIQQHQTAFLGEQNKPDIFKIRIGYLKPGTQVKVVIGYVAEVKNEKGSSAIRFFLPTTVAPRYIPPTETDTKSLDLANIKYSHQSPAQMDIQVNVVLQGGIKDIKSPSHSITVAENGPVPQKMNWSRSIVHLRGLCTDMDRDFVILITPEEAHAPKLYMETIEKAGNKSSAVMTHLIPSFKLDEQKTELIFLLDQSGSMQGNSIQLAKNALTLFLHSLPIDCYFNVVGFGSSFYSLFPTSVKYDDSNLRTALQATLGLSANMGGTEIFRPLLHIYNLADIPGYLRQIFVLTDGEVSNTEKVLGLTKINAHRVRLFSLGIGHSASHHLVEGLASNGGGTSVFVTQNEPFEAKVLQQLKNAIEPSLTDITVEWDGFPASDSVNSEPPVEINREKTLFGYGKPIGETPIPTEIQSPQEELYKQAPRKVPPIFDGSQMILFGIFPDRKLPTGVTITAVSPDGPLSIKIPLSEENDVGPTGMLHSLAAIKIVRELEMDLTATNDFTSIFSRERRQQFPEKMKSEIIKIACRNGIASKFTSFIAVDESNTESAEHWVMQSRFVPSQLPPGQGFGGFANYNHSTLHTPQPFSTPCSFSFHSNVSSNCPTFGGSAHTTQACSTNIPSTTLFGLAAQPPPPQLMSAQMPQQQMMSVLRTGSLFGSSQSQATSGTLFIQPQSFYSGPGPQLQPAAISVSSSSNSSNASHAFSFRSAPPTESAKNDPQDSLHQLISVQSFLGVFSLDSTLASTIGKDLDDLRRVAAENSWDESAWATALALVFMSEKLADRKEAWELVYKKARKWLEKNCEIHLDSILAAASKIIL